MQVSLAWVVSRALLGRVSYEHGAAGLWPYLGADAPSALSRHGDGLFLLPLFDMINHSSDAAARSTVLRHLETGGGGARGRAARFQRCGCGGLGRPPTRSGALLRAVGERAWRTRNATSFVGDS